MSQSIERTIDVLEAVGDEPLTPAEVSRRLDVHRSTALRIMEALQDRRMLRKLPDGRYGIGPGLIALANRGIDQSDITSVAHPRLVELSSLYDQTVHLAGLRSQQIVYIDKVEPKRSVRLLSRVGEAVCLHTAAVAKVILAYESPENRARLLNGHRYQKFTDTTLTSRRELEAELLTVRTRGWASDDGEMEDYINCLGVPIRDASGGVVAAVSVTEIKAIKNLDQMHSTILRPLQRIAAAISQDLGAPLVAVDSGTNKERQECG